MNYSLKEIKIILASQSKVRKEILDKNNINCVVEKSNVDVVTEMINLVSAQRAYEVNSKTIKTADELLSMTNNLKR